ncbi:MAG: hypothetical protein L0H63_16125 [Nitrococcus sp.]|nr:hypothetical protein [Nitrococcus sp.]
MHWRQVPVRVPTALQPTVQQLNRRATVALRRAAKLPAGDRTDALRFETLHAAIEQCALASLWGGESHEAIQVIESMPKTKLEIFPYSPDAITANFTRACKLLAIDDLRHEGISRLFEMGRNIPQVAAVSRHRSWVSLKRYTHIREAGDKYGDWGGLSSAINNP